MIRNRGTQVSTSEDFIKFIKDDMPNSSALKPALIKEEIWLPISLHLNGEIIDENQTKCYVKKNQQGILRFFIEVSSPLIWLNTTIFDNFFHLH